MIPKYNIQKIKSRLEGNATTWTDYIPPNLTFVTAYSKSTKGKTTRYYKSVGGGRKVRVGKAEYMASQQGQAEQKANRLAEKQRRRNAVPTIRSIYDPDRRQTIQYGTPLELFANEFKDIGILYGTDRETFLFPANLPVFEYDDGYNVAIIPGKGRTNPGGNNDSFTWHDLKKPILPSHYAEELNAEDLYDDLWYDDGMDMWAKNELTPVQLSLYEYTSDGVLAEVVQKNNKLYFVDFEDIDPSKFYAYVPEDWITATAFENFTGTDNFELKLSNLSVPQLKTFFNMMKDLCDDDSNCYRSMFYDNPTLGNQPLDSFYGEGGLGNYKTPVAWFDWFANNFDGDNFVDTNTSFTMQLYGFNPFELPGYKIWSFQNTYIVGEPDNFKNSMFEEHTLSYTDYVFEGDIPLKLGWFLGMVNDVIEENDEVENEDGEVILRDPIGDALVSIPNSIYGPDFPDVVSHLCKVLDGRTATLDFVQDGETLDVDSWYAYLPLKPNWPLDLWVALSNSDLDLVDKLNEYDLWYFPEFKDFVVPIPSNDEFDLTDLDDFLGTLNPDQFEVIE